MSFPPTTRARLEAALEVFFPKAASNQWRFPLEIMEIEPGRPVDVLQMPDGSVLISDDSGNRLIRVSYSR